MEISWLGNDSIKITSGRNNTIVTNPYKDLKKESASLYIYSREDESLYKEKDDTYIVDWPGEYEVAESLITGVELDEDSLLLHTGYNIHTSEDISIVFLGSITKTLSGKHIEELGSTDILVIDIEHLEAQEAHKLVNQIEPKFTIPLYTSKEKHDAFLKVSGNPQLEEKSSFKITKNDIPMEGHSIVVLSSSI